MTEEPTIVGESRLVGDPVTRIVDHGGPDSGPVLLLLHGFGGSALNWNDVGPDLAKRHRTVAVDFFAHGRSAAPKGLTARTLVNQLESVIASMPEVRDRPLVLVAGSFGSTIAFLFAQTRPDLVRAIAVVDGALPVHPDRGFDLAMTAKRWLISIPGVSGLIFRKASGMTPREYVEFQLTEAGVDPAVLTPETMRVSVELEDARHLDRQAHDAQQHLLRDLLRIFARGRAFSAMVASAKAPVLWLHSTDDPLIGFELAKGFVAQHPAWTFASRDGLGHVPMVSDPAWVTDEVLTWLDGLDSTPQR